MNETLRINGTAEIRDDMDLIERFEVNGKLPKTVFVVSVKEAFLHCAKALMRSNLWSPDARILERPRPAIGQMMKEQSGDNSFVESQAEMEANFKKDLY